MPEVTEQVRSLPEREELLLLTVALDDSGCVSNRLLAILKEQPDEAVKREFHNVCEPLEFAE